MVDRTADQIQRDIEQARGTLASTVDQIAYRTNPKRVVENAKQALISRAKTPRGQAVLGGVGLVAVVLLARRLRKR